MEWCWLRPVVKFFIGQASTQYQGNGSNHELAALLVIEVVQHSLHVLKQPVYLLALDAQSAFDRCLRQILICELFKAGVRDDSLAVIDNRLLSRSTVYEWNKQLLGPAPDETGFEQGAINSSDYYKLYNNEQLETAQATCLGVDLGSSVVSAVGQADDVLLCSNNIDSLRLLATLTERYCQKYNVKLVPSKTKLLGYTVPAKSYLMEHAKLINSITINNQPVVFTEEFEHVGILRNSAGNLPHIMNRINAHKNGMNFVLSAGLARSHHGNPAASLKVQELYGTPKLFSGLAPLALTRSETSVIDGYYQRVIMNLQRLHKKTPRCFIFLMAGCLPGEAVLHQKQLTLFCMICNLPGDPLNAHARHVLVTAKNSSNSWFLKIRDLCLLYGLDHPLKLLDSPPTKARFKKQVKDKIITHWENILRGEAAELPSLCFFMASNSSLKYPHHVWSTAKTSFECRKATVLALMMSGRFRSEYLTRHWSLNKLGLCQAGTCDTAIGDLEHLLIHCPALEDTRARMWHLMSEKARAFPAFYFFLKHLEKSPPKTKLQFLLDPSAFQDILEIIKIFGHPVLDLISYLNRTFVYYLYRQKQLLVGWWKSDNTGKNRPKKPSRHSSDKNNDILITGSRGAVVHHHLVRDTGGRALPCRGAASVVAGAAELGSGFVTPYGLENPMHDYAQPMELEPDQNLVVPAVHPNHGTVLHHRATAAELAGRTIAMMSHGDSASVKCNSKNYLETLVLPDCGDGGELPSRRGQACGRGGGDGAVSGLQLPPSLL